MRRRAVLLLLLAASVGGATLASASTLGAVTVQGVTAYAAASTVPTSSCSSSPTQDSWIDAQHITFNNGTATTLTVAQGNKPAYALVQFSPCASANAHVVSATLQMLLSTAPAGTRTWGVYPITQSWAEGSVDWKAQPTISGTASASQTTGGAGSTVQWTLTGDVQGIVNGGANNGWAIEDNGAGTDSGALDSREGATPPALAIVYYP